MATFEDLSGISTGTFANPYDALIHACNNDPKAIQSRYTTHRTTRNASQASKLLSPFFPGVTTDPILQRLADPTIEPGYQDPRHCLVFWARPPQRIKDLILRIQKELLTVAPNLWIMPQPNLHMTVLEITHSKTSQEITSLVSILRPSIPDICDYPQSHRTLLTKPMISFDASALALSFVPADSEPYTYHHLRRDVYELCSKAGVQVESRYVVPSSHLTIGRFIKTSDFEDQGKFAVKKMEAFIERIEEINKWLEEEYWPRGEQTTVPAGDWYVGEEKGLDCRMGRLWYGDGETVYLGKGF